ncbi:hypothetical protein LSH36_12g17005 [Paralvinella palmiformis]|uniref:Calcineurin-like phosphoesterase domain-containing protein n=1 Tax=Paralvinella palmiformis TaxID=53620 RepID=A0AAD9KD47_9ANNE|nr:hypothetical protein LSH36_12g17005 [Paralvinella palmiformis]
MHDEYVSLIPNGDILVHSGDFFNFHNPKQELKSAMKMLDTFFKKMPHKYKIFVAGNHDLNLEYDAADTSRIDSLLPHGIYLCDRKINLYDINFYGTPWNNSIGMSFYEQKLKSVWEKVPEDTDILITHIPPFGINDYGCNKFWDGETWICDYCTEANPEKGPVYHGYYSHQGCPHLKEAIFSKIRPKIHLFGHVHNRNGVVQHKGILFCNGALQYRQVPIVIDYHRRKKTFNCVC